VNAYSICDRITRWVDDQIDKEDPLGADEWGRHVTMALAQTPNGDAVIWCVLITIRAPFLGLDAIGSTFKIAANVPAEAMVRANVTQATGDLRKEFTRRRGDGFPPPDGRHHQNGLPPGLAGHQRYS
jgi:hypothetical protein